MKNIFIIIFCLVLVLIPSVYSSAQKKAKQEVVIQAGGGVSTLKYTLDKGEYNQGFGAVFGFGYNYFINETFSFNTGLELSLYNAKASLGSLSDKYMTYDDDGVPFELRYNIEGYEETQSAMFVTIPIMAQYQSSGKRKFYMAFGGKIGLPVNAKYKASESQVKASGYYPDYNLVIEELYFRGFGSFTSRSVNEKIDLKMAFMVAVEFGMKWELSSSRYLYTGAYIDYGLNSVVKENNNVFLIYNQNDPVNYKTNSILTAQYTQNENTNSFTDKVMPMAIGLKVGLAFGLN